MNKFMLIAVFAATVFNSNAQSVFDKYEDMEAVSSVIVNKNMFQLLMKMDVDINDPEGREFMDIAKSLDGVKVFITEDKSVSSDMKATVDRYLKSSALSELMRVKDKDANVKFYIREGKDSDHVSELLMFVTGMNNSDIQVNDRKPETVLLTITGDIDLTKIGALTRKMNLPDELNKAGKSKS